LFGFLSESLSRANLISTVLSGAIRAGRTSTVPWGVGLAVLLPAKSPNANEFAESEARLLNLQGKINLFKN
jgi:hypothetical protein